ncbi:hypothetical protein E2C01_093342 [Portunus trituberculatus]|uniref:Uncharacterized protein n=1 Tax=Portunus trituberculatus TaxID=210409 RepID=A0A5B7JU73_PORTR|nr:hypothetical protein [Portunus trituberculatus]
MLIVPTTRHLAPATSAAAAHQHTPNHHLPRRRTAFWFSWLWVPPRLLERNSIWDLIHYGPGNHWNELAALTSLVDFTRDGEREGTVRKHGKKHHDHCLICGAAARGQEAELAFKQLQPCHSDPRRRGAGVRHDLSRRNTLGSVTTCPPGDSKGERAPAFPRRGGTRSPDFLGYKYRGAWFMSPRGLHHLPPVAKGDPAPALTGALGNKNLPTTREAVHPVPTPTALPPPTG